MMSNGQIGVFSSITLDLARCVFLKQHADEKEVGIMTNTAYLLKRKYRMLNSALILLCNKDYNP